MAYLNLNFTLMKIKIIRIGFGVKFFSDNKTQFFTPPEKYNIYNSNECIIVPEDNSIILFFSQLRHKLMPNQSTKDRFSLSKSSRANYARGEDAYEPVLSQAVVFPETNEEVANILKLCNCTK